MEGNVLFYLVPFAGRKTGQQVIEFINISVSNIVPKNVVDRKDCLVIDSKG